jgi:hypothetical protein
MFAYFDTKVRRQCYRYLTAMLRADEFHVTGVLITTVREGNVVFVF